MRALRIVALVCASAAAGPLGGCISWAPEPPAAAAPEARKSDPAELRLVEAVERAERALASLARALPEPDPLSEMPRLESVPAALRAPVTLDWTGPVETLAAALARRAGYRFHMAGSPPPRPLVVAVEADGVPLLAVLRDTGLRAGGMAMLTVDAARETVLLDWAAPASRDDG